MSIKEKTVCQLCCNVSVNNFKVNDVIKDIVHILVPNINLDICENPVICNDCIEIVKKCFFFKLVCINTEKYIHSYAAGKQEAQFDINDIYMTNANASIGKNFKICRLCMSQWEFIVMDSYLPEAELVQMLPIFMPEMDIDIVKSPLSICTLCGDNLKRYFMFVHQRLEAEEKINTKLQYESNNSTSLAQLKNLLKYFLFKDNSDYPDKYSHISNFTQEGTFENLENGVGGRKLTRRKRVKLVTETKMFKCTICTYEAKRKPELNRHMIKHKDASEVTMYKCTICTHETKYKSALRDHMLTHADTSKINMYICVQCNHRTKHKKALKAHMLIHNDKSKVTLYKCAICNHQTKYKRALEKHVLTHKNCSKMTMYQCSMCTYQVRHKTVLQNHMHVHKDAFKKMHKCALCTLQTKYRSNLGKHLLKDIVDVLLLNINLVVYENPVICKDCIEILKKCLFYKLVCMKTEKCILSFALDKQKAQFNINDIYVDNENENAVTDVDFKICRLCMSQWECIVMGNVWQEAELIQMLPVFMPEMDPNIVKNPLSICTLCRDNLKCYFMFVHQCLEAEEKINTRHPYEGNNSTSPVKLKNLLEYFLSKDNSEYLDQSHMNDFKHEVTFETQGNNVTDSKLTQQESIELSTGIKVHKCTICTYQTKGRAELKRHMLIHKDASEVTMYKCTMCTLETKYKSALSGHMLTHADTSKIKMYKCILCDHKTKHKKALKVHMLTHNDNSKVTLYKCPICNHETKYKVALKRHMLTHKDTSEATVYQCSMCPYETKDKNSLQNHMRIHKDISKIRIYKCTICSLQTKYKSNLRKHMLTHKNTTEVILYKCTDCKYETRHKSSLQRHYLLIHKDISHVQMFKCAICSYETKYKTDLQSHELIHKDMSDLQMYACTMCTYETKYQHALRKHTLTHQGNSKLEIYTCPMCSFETKYKNNVERHMVIHRDRSNV